MWLGLNLTDSSSALLLFVAVSMRNVPRLLEIVDKLIFVKWAMKVVE